MAKTYKNEVCMVVKNPTSANRKMNESVTVQTTATPANRKMNASAEVSPKK